MNKAGIIWFSQTGNSYVCAQRLKRRLLEQQFELIDDFVLSDMQVDFNSLTHLFFVFPVYNFKMPCYLRDYIEALSCFDQKVKVYAIITAGGMEANTAWILDGLLKKKKAQLDDYLVVYCEDSYIPLRKFLGTKKQKNKPDESSFLKIDQFLFENVLHGKLKNKIRFNPLNPFHWLGHLAPPTGPKQFLGKRSFVKERCVDCSICYNICPAGAIVKENDDIKYNDQLCIGCCSCFNGCPTDAWQSPWYSSKHYYHSPFLKEMLKGRQSGLSE